MHLERRWKGEKNSFILFSVENTQTYHTIKLKQSICNLELKKKQKQKTKPNQQQKTKQNKVWP